MVHHNVSVSKPNNAAVVGSHYYGISLGANYGPSSVADYNFLPTCDSSLVANHNPAMVGTNRNYTLSDWYASLVGSDHSILVGSNHPSTLVGSDHSSMVGSNNSILVGSNHPSTLVGSDDPSALANYARLAIDVSSTWGIVAAPALGFVDAAPF